MRVVLLFICLLFSGNVIIARPGDELEGTYKRFLHRAKGSDREQTLRLSGTTGGRYTIEVDGGDGTDFTSGAWIKSRIEGRGRMTLDVVILDPENKFESRYYVINPITRCLTPAYEDGEQIKHANAFAPVRKSRSR